MRTRCLLLATLIAGCGGSKPPPAEPPPPPTASSDEPPGQVELQAAMKAARENDLDAAIERAKAAIDKNPQLEQAYLLYGSSCAMKEDDACEIEAYQRGLQALPTSASLKKAMALVHLQKNQMEDAIKMLEELNDGQDPEVMADLAYAYIFVDRTDEGEKLATKALELNPKCFQCNMTLGQIHLSKKQFDQAIESYGRAGELEPNDPGPKRKMAQATYLAGKKAEALGMYSAELAKYGDDDELRFEYAKALLGAKKPKEAIAEIKKLLEKNADEPNLLKMLLKAQKEAKDKKGAKATEAKLKKLGVKP